MLNAVFILIVTYLFGCSRNPKGINEPENTSSITELNILSLTDKPRSLKKVIKVDQWVTKKDGGELIIDYKGYEHDNGDVEAKITLKIFSGSISEDVKMSLILDDQLLLVNTAVEFSPHGVVFFEPALLNIEVKHIDLSDSNPNAIDIYYDNRDDDDWEVTDSKEIIVKTDEGYVKVIDAEIHHFSRYAVAHSQ